MRNSTKLFLLISCLIISSNALIVEFTRVNENTCFYIRGHYTNEEFKCQYSVSGDSPSELETTFGEMGEEELIFEQKAGESTSAGGIIKAQIKKEGIYRLCFTSTDKQRKMVAFDYVQTHRRSHYSKRDIKETNKLLDELVQNQLELDTRLSFFQSNVFAHTQVLENHKSSIIWSSVTKLGAMILVATLQVNFLMKLMEQTNSSITDLI